MDARLAQAADILAPVDAAFRHHRHVLGNRVQEVDGGVQTRGEGAEVPVVDAEQRCLHVQGGVEFGTVVDFDENVGTPTSPPMAFRRKRRRAPTGMAREASTARIPKARRCRSSITRPWQAGSRIARAVVGRLHPGLSVLAPALPGRARPVRNADTRSVPRSRSRRAR